MDQSITWIFGGMNLSNAQFNLTVNIPEGSCQLFDHRLIFGNYSYLSASEGFCLEALPV